MTVISTEQRIAAIVIGTSAGGIEALSILLPSLPATLRAAVMVVIHMPKDRPSLLVELFEEKCQLRVCEAMDKETIEPGTVYFAPPDYHLLVDRGPQLALSADERVNYSRPSIDVLFESAADVYGKQLLGILLTGGNHDGAAGLKAIQRAGGMTAVQQPDTAAVDIMPLSALEQITPDYVLSLTQIAALLKQLPTGDEP